MKTFALRILPALVFCLTASTGIAAERTNPNVEAPNTDAPEVSESPVKEKRWFMGGSLGMAGVDYSGPVKSEIIAHRNSAGSEKTPGIFLEGFFGWRLSNHKTIIGPSLSILQDSYDSDFTSDLELTTYFLSFMVQHYFGGDFHRGLFARLDAGVAGIAANYTYGTTSSSAGDHSYGGSGLRVGLGYTIPLGDKLGLPISAHYQYISARDEVESNAGILSVGLIF